MWLHTREKLTFLFISMLPQFNLIDTSKNNRNSD